MNGQEQHEWDTETNDPMTRGEDDMRGRINTVGIDQAARIVADAWAPPFDLKAHARLQGIIRAAWWAGRSHQQSLGSDTAAF